MICIVQKLIKIDKRACWHSVVIPGSQECEVGGWQGQGLPVIKAACEQRSESISQNTK